MFQASLGSDTSHRSFAQNLIRTSLAVTSVRPLCRFSLFAKFTFQGLFFLLYSDVTQWVMGLFLNSHVLKSFANIFHKACSKYTFRKSKRASLCSYAGKLFGSSRWLWSDMRPCVSAESTAAAFPLGVAVSTSSGNSYTVHIFTSSLYVQLKWIML